MYTIFKVPTASAAETNNGLSERTWAIDSNGGFVVIDRPPVFTVSVPESIYDEPTMEPNESLGEVFADASKCIFPIIFLVLFQVQGEKYYLESKRTNVMSNLFPMK